MVSPLIYRSVWEHYDDPSRSGFSERVHSPPASSWVRGEISVALLTRLLAQAGVTRDEWEGGI